MEPTPQPARTSTCRQKRRILMKLHYAELFETFLHTQLRRPEAVLARRGRDADPAARRDRRAGRRRSASRRSSSAWPTAAGSTCWPTSCDKPYEEIFAEFEDNYLPDSIDGDGDVKYHLGFSADRVDRRRASDPPVADAQPEPPRGGQPGRRGPDAGQAAAVRATRDRKLGHAAPDPRRRRLRRPGPRRRDAEPVATAGLHDRRHDPRRRQQPDRLHDRARATPARRRTAPTSPR